MSTPHTSDMHEFFHLTGNTEDKQDFRRAALWMWIHRQLIPGRVIDIGGGAGYIASRAALAGYDTVLAEPDTEILGAGQTSIEATSGSLEVMQAYAEDLDPAEIGTFENMLSLDVLEHIEDDARALQNMVRLLAPEGQAIITVPAIPALYGKRDKAYGHYRRHTPETLRQLITQAGLEIVQMRWWNLIGVPPYFFYEKVLQKPIGDLRTQKNNPLAKLTREGLYHWLVAETHLPMPRGLSLLAIARHAKQG